MALPVLALGVWSVVAAAAPVKLTDTQLDGLSAGT